VFEIELMNLGDKYALPVLLYLFRRIQRSSTGDPPSSSSMRAWLMLDCGVPSPRSGMAQGAAQGELPGPDGDAKPFRRRQSGFWM
jgi:hypothetical protein